MLGDALTGAGTSILAEVTDALGPALTVALPIVGIYVGWKIFRRFVKA